MTTQVLYNPATRAGVKSFGLLDFLQLPTPDYYVDSPADLFRNPTGLGFAIATYNPNTYVPNANFGSLYLNYPRLSVVGRLNVGTTVNTNGTFPGQILPPSLTGYAVVPYLATVNSGNPTFIASGETLTFNDKYRGYAGFSSHRVNFDFTPANFNPSTLATLNPQLVPVNAIKPLKLGAEAGFSLNFALSVLEEDNQGSAFRSGFNITLITDSDLDGNGKYLGIELGFEDDYNNGRDRIVARNGNFGISGAVDVDNISKFTGYNLRVIDDQFFLTSGGKILLNGALREYNFNPATSSPALPPGLNPYETPNYLFIGDNTDQAYSRFRLGRTSVTDIAKGNDGNNRYLGTAAADFYSGGAGNDIISGGAGDDYLKGDDGNDIINGGAGNDFIFGGDGDDLITVSGGNDSIDGGSGIDTLRFRGLRYVSVTSGGITPDSYVIGQFVSPTTSNSFLQPVVVNGVQVAERTVRSLGSGTFQNIDRLSIAGTDFSDYLDASGSVQQTTISGGGGNDFIFGGTNNDLLIGGLGNDVIVGGAGDDEIRGGAGADQLFGGIGDDILFGGAGGDLLNGYGGGALEKDVLSGGGRDLRRDTFVLGDASAIFYRNSGNNDFAVITDFERGFDIIQLRGAATAYELVAEVSVVVGMTTYTGTGIYSLSGGSDLIGVVQGAISLDLENSRQFVYV